MEKLMNDSDMNQGKRKKKRNILDSRTSGENGKRGGCQAKNCCSGSGRQFLPDRQPADIEYNSCYLQSKTLSSYNHKAAQPCVTFI
ncbi:hypothetical protein WR25_03249 [Diploscapter pachys]|uniref:Uncharacterized protein n=1 Tax=Diploscapter pachys TaxID=2018661 RepID=A0A2A2JQD8_9BILA|nr:hypothetical protein WR25_03249 [Diploscapter pachys]